MIFALAALVTMFLCVMIGYAKNNIRTYSFWGDAIVSGVFLMLGTCCLAGAIYVGMRLFV